MIGEIGPGDYRVGYGSTPPNLELSLSETITTVESQGGYTNDPDHLAIYAYEEVDVRDQPVLPIVLRAHEAISLVEFLRMGRNLGIRRNEIINADDVSPRLFVPVQVALQVFETITVVDRTTWRSPVLIIRAHEVVSLAEGPTNGGANGNTLVVGPAPAPVTIPDDYWVVGV